ncbi:MAG: membrane protein insertase YidC, partial [Chitinophagaceae bacterium]
MDKNTFTGFFLILVILVGSTFLLKPNEEDLKREQLVQDSIKNAKEGRKIAIAAKPQIAVQPKALDSATLKGPFGAALSGSEETIVLENEELKINISSKGGRVASVELKKHKNYDQKPVVLFTAAESSFNVVLKAAGKDFSTKDLFFTASAKNLKVNKGDSSSVILSASYGANQSVEFVYSLKGEGFKLGFDIVTKGLENVITTSPVIYWDAVLRQKEKDLASEQKYSGAYYKYTQSEPDRIGMTKDEKKDLGEDGKIQWISFKQHFFSNVLIAKDGFEKASLDVKTSPEKGIVKTYTASLTLPAKKQSYPLEFYFGPNRFNTLKDQGYDLDKLVDLGWGPLK